VIALTGLARGEPNGIEIVGVCPNQVLMTWTVTNHGTEPVSRLEFPVDHVNRANPPPDGWEIEQFVRMKRGNLVYRSRLPESDIRRGQSLQFTCRLHRIALQLREGTVRVGLRTGSTVSVSGVLLPARHGVWEVYGLPVFLLGLLGLVLLYRTLKHSRTAKRGGAGASAGPKNDVSGG
jgi:hypothetical protein